ncbi:hypothetical protein PCO31110_03969 [Pandoraea communis]|uniref:Uncharacterized protein n=1 Tax=Pandoraea communis TaxID=2508297 RepID=A0A5E4XJ27_9BURK|nr:hypothetical protein PCO31110_03969 [Pandoraea communis]
MHDDDAVEMLRVWTADQTMYRSMKIGMYQETKRVSEEAIWGAILADVARQVSTTLQQSYPRTDTDSLALVREHFLKELGTPNRHVQRRYAAATSLRPRPPFAITRRRHGSLACPSSHATPSSASSRVPRPTNHSPQRAPSRTRAISSVVRLITAPTIRYSPGASLLPDAAISHATASGVKPPKIVVPRL